MPKITAAVWALTTLLTVMFASRVAPLMPPAVGVAVWIMAVATDAGGFWAFFFLIDYSPRVEMLLLLSHVLLFPLFLSVVLLLVLPLCTS
jgi:hypothetical protein